MPIPPSFLQHVEQHGCFSGCYGSESDVSTCLDPQKPLQALLVVSCRDCFARVGVPKSLLPAGSTSSWLADQVTLHLRKLRGFTLALSGYHARGPGFWLSVAYYGSCGLFLVNGERSRALGSDLDLLMLAFRHGVLTPPDPRMLDPKQYVVQPSYVNFAGPPTPIGCKQDLLSSPHYRAQPGAGFERVSLVEFQPLARQAPPAGAPTKKAAPAPAKPLKVGDTCPVCGHKVQVRNLLQGTFVGCMC